MAHFSAITAAFLLFALLHSLLANPEIRRILQRAMGSAAPYYRLMYNFLSLLLLVGIYIWLPPRGEVLYDFRPPWSWLMHTVQLGAATAFVMTLRDFSLREFLGIANIRSAASDPAEQLNLKGTFQYCRHPLYTATTVFLLAQPTMTIGMLAWTLNIVLYFVIGSYFEERNLEARFGQVYRDYRLRVPKFIPRLRKRG